jgi:hypothetical protein
MFYSVGLAVTILRLLAVLDQRGERLFDFSGGC